MHGLFAYTLRKSELGWVMCSAEVHTRSCRWTMPIITWRHLFDVADSHVHEGLQSAVQSVLLCCTLWQIAPHPGKAVEGSRDVDCIEVLAAVLNNAEHGCHTVSIDNTAVDVPVKVRDWLWLLAADGRAAIAFFNCH